MPRAGVTGRASGVTAEDAVVADRYELGALLGRGAMGEVRAGRDRRLGRDVAVKLLLPALADDRSAHDRFRDEARAAARIEHPHVVAVFDTGEHDGVPYLVMERLPGRTLADEISAGPLPAPRVRALGLQLLGAVQAAHEAGVLHRDIKPSNILLTADGEAKLGDLGIAKVVEGEDRTATGIVVGTPTYLAPERMAGEPASERTDIYAVGVVLSEALTGRTPATARTAEPTVVERVDGGDPVLLGAIERASAADPDERFGSAAEMAAAIAPSPSPMAASTTAAASGATDASAAGVAGRPRRPPAATVQPGSVAAARAVSARPASTARRWVVGGVVVAALAGTGAMALDRIGGQDADRVPQDAPAVTVAPTSEPPPDEVPPVDAPVDPAPAARSGAATGGDEGGGGDEAGGAQPGGDGPGAGPSRDGEGGAEVSAGTDDEAEKAAKAAEEEADKAAKAAGEEADKAAKAAGEEADKAAKAAEDEAEKAAEAAKDRAERDARSGGDDADEERADDDEADAD